MNNPNTEPVEQWLTVWASLTKANTYTSLDNRINALTNAVTQLCFLLEPPSVRNIRQHQEDDE